MAARWSGSPLAFGGVVQRGRAELDGGEQPPPIGVGEGTDDHLGVRAVLADVVASGVSGISAIQPSNGSHDSLTAICWATVIRSGDSAEIPAASGPLTRAEWLRRPLVHVETTGRCLPPGERHQSDSGKRR